MAYIRMSLGRYGVGDAAAAAQLVQNVSQGFMAQQQAAMMQSLGPMQEELAKRFKKAALTSAAAQTAVTVSMAAIPLVGWAASAISGVVGSVFGGKYKGEAESIMNEAQNTVARIQAESESRINAMLDAVWAQEKDAAIQMAASGQGLDGLDGFSFKGIVRSVGKVATAIIPKPVQKLVAPITKEIQKGLDIMTGRNIKVEAQKARDKIINEAKAKVAEHEKSVKSVVDSPAFRANFRKELAKAIRSNLPLGATQGGTGVKVAQPSGFTGAPLIAGAIAAGALLLFK